MFSQRATLALTLVTTVASSPLLLDDAGPHIRPGTEWMKAEGSCAHAGHAGGFHHNNGVHNGEAFAVWNFSIPTDGCYWVEEFHPDTTGCEFSLSNKVPVTIHFCKGLHTSGLIDQSHMAGQWNKLVRLPFYATHSAAIHISAKGLPGFEGAGHWAADAFRLTWDANTCHDEAAEAHEAVEPEETVEPTKEEVETVVAVEKEEEEPRLPLLQALVDHKDAKVLGATLEPIQQCPAAPVGDFSHDDMKKSRRAEAIFHFMPPHDGCYLVEELHPELQKCQASTNTKVDINYCKGGKATGTVDQSANPGQWTFLAALPFYAGVPGNVTLSNEGTSPGTLAIFNQVRFTWSGKHCERVDAHPRKVEIRMTVDFENVAGQLSEFGSTLKAKLAALADVPEKALRLIDLRPGSIIAEFLVVPSAVASPWASGLSARQTIEKLQGAVTQNAAELCDLTGAPDNCKIEFTDFGIPIPSVLPVPKQPTQQAEQTEETESQPEEKSHGLVIILASVACGALVLAGLVVTYFKFSSRKATKDACKSTAESEEVVVSLEEGKIVEEKKAEDLSDTNSTTCPSSDKQSEPSINGDIDSTMTPAATSAPAMTPVLQVAPLD